MRCTVILGSEEVVDQHEEVALNVVINVRAPGPQQWKHGFLNTGPPGNSQEILILIGILRI